MDSAFGMNANSNAHQPISRTPAARPQARADRSALWPVRAAGALPALANCTVAMPFATPFTSSSASPGQSRSTS